MQHLNFNEINDIVHRTDNKPLYTIVYTAKRDLNSEKGIEDSYRLRELTSQMQLKSKIAFSRMEARNFLNKLYEESHNIEIVVIDLSTGKEISLRD